MTKELSLVPFSEFSNNVGSFFVKVLRENKEIVIENDSGEQVLLKPAPKENSALTLRLIARHSWLRLAVGKM